MIVLAVDTAGRIASVALFRDGDACVERSASEPRAHASHVLALVGEVLAESGTPLAAVDRYAFGRGPGGLTGLRVAASVVQGFAFVLERPVVSLSNLTAMARKRLVQDAGRSDADGVMACHDAGMGQVVCGFFAVRDGWPEPLCAESFGRPEEVSLRAGNWLAVGSGCALIERHMPANSAMLDVTGDVGPLAAQLAELGARSSEVLGAPEAAQPLYLRHPVNG